jgi:AraC-like DNA-binding protein
MTGFHQISTSMPGLRFVSAQTAHVFARHSHDEFGIGVMLAGSQISASGRGQVTAQTGHVITVNPGEVHDGSPLGGRPRRWAMVYLTPDRMAELAIGLRGTSGQVEFEAPVLSQPALAAKLSTLLAAIAQDNPPIPCQALEESLLRLLSLVIRPGQNGRPATNSAALQRAITMIDDDPTSNTSLEQLAREAGLTRFQTLRAFASATGFTPHAYLMQRRFDLARQLMTTPSGLAEVAAASGYADQSHMTRDFKRRYGLTPAAYRAANGSCNSIQDRP